MSAAEDLPLFFSRNGLSVKDAETCMAFAAQGYPDNSLRLVPQQGGCSFTVIADGPGRAEATHHSTACLDDRTIVQFRLLKHAIPVAMAATASRIYCPLAPKTEELGRISVGEGLCLQVTAMSCIPGERFSEVQPRAFNLDRSVLERCKGLMRSLSTFFARSWCNGQLYTPALSACTGKVGQSLLYRLESLERHLPSKALRQRAQKTRDAVEKGGMDLLPVVLTHGDLLPTNILVDECTWLVKGYVDWAEAEYLSCGICLYGLEHLLGYLEDSESARRPRFVYYDQAAQLRSVFWTSFEQQVPEIARQHARDALMLARDVGILLWKGVAWDDGSIDRVVNPMDDAEEVACLEAFLGLESRMTRHDSVIDGDNSPFKAC